MRLAAIVDHRGRSATAIEMSVFFVDSEISRDQNEILDFTVTARAAKFSFAPLSRLGKQLRGWNPLDITDIS